jgi:hypothetical protein
LGRINKYAEAEKTDRYGRGEIEHPVDDELLEKLVITAKQQEIIAHDVGFLREICYTKASIDLEFQGE